ncbi:MAG: T9SS type A sorting domain-containing protein [bacterium]
MDSRRFAFLHRTDRSHTSHALVQLGALALIAAALIIAAPAALLATPYWTPADYDAALASGAQPALEAGFSSRLSLPPTGAPNAQDYIAQFAAAAAFVADWQVTIPGPTFGGIREAEHLPNIIQTDNTSESIWLWTRYYALTGDTTYFQNVRDSFTYSLVNPAYNEEGGSLAINGYYRMYNCGWAAFSEWYYRSVTGDMTYKTYGDSCASYIANRNLNRQAPDTFNQYVNPPVLAWAAGNLAIVGGAQGRQDWVDAAESRVSRVKGWVDGEPALLYNETWAMSGGASMYGILNGWFNENPDSLTIWTDVMRDSMESYSTLGEFTNAWNGWYALGHHTLWSATQYEPARLRSLAISDTMIAEDGDSDGGIPARPVDADSMDHTWITSYLAFMSINPQILNGTDVPPNGDVTGSLPERLIVRASPNPFRSETTILMSRPASSNESIRIYDLSGRIVRDFDDRVWALGGLNPVVDWDGRDNRGRDVPPGVYLLRMETSGADGATKITRLR